MEWAHGTGALDFLWRAAIRETQRYLLGKCDAPQFSRGLFSGMRGRERGNDPVNVFVEGVAELIEDQDVVRSFLRWRAGKLGLDPDYPRGDFVPLLIRTTPLYLRAEGFTGRRHPVVYTSFPGVDANAPGP